MEVDIRNCPQCNKKLEYSLRCNLLRAIRKNALCRKCACNSSSRINKIRVAHLGTKRHFSIGKKISESKMGHIVTEKTRNKISESHKGKSLTSQHKKNIGRGVKKYYSNISNRQKKRIETIKRIEKNKLNGGQLYPRYNPEACKIIDDYGKKHGYNFQHAENGGEYHIKKLGYWVDGYDREQNIVIEYYEKLHNRTKERDERRKQEIVDYLGCKFIELQNLEYRSVI